MMRATLLRSFAFMDYRTKQTIEYCSQHSLLVMTYLEQSILFERPLNGFKQLGIYVHFCFFNHVSMCSKGKKIPSGLQHLLSQSRIVVAYASIAFVTTSDGAIDHRAIHFCDVRVAINGQLFFQIRRKAFQILLVVIITMHRDPAGTPLLLTIPC